MSQAVIQEKINKCIVQVLTENPQVKANGLKLPQVMEKLLACNKTLRTVSKLQEIVQKTFENFQKEGILKKDEKNRFVLIGCPKPQQKIVSLEKKIKRLPPAVAQNINKRGVKKLTKSALEKEQTDEVFKAMMLEKAGVDFKEDPQKVVRLILPSDAPKLNVVGNALESVSEGIITNAIPTTAINALDPVATEEVALTLNFQVQKPPAGDAASKQVQAKPTMLLKEPNYKTEYLECEVLHDAFNTQTFFQAKGSVLPKWFPGYFTAFPEENPILLPHKSPSFVLLRAWKSLQPDYMKP